MTKAATHRMRRLDSYNRAKEWWTRPRVVAGLRRFHRETGLAPLATHAYHVAARGPGKGPRRRWPSFYAVLKHFRTFREAWEAIGIRVDRHDAEWSDVEEWYLREAAGILTRNQIAVDLRRTPGAVHRRLYDLGLHSYRVHGWTANRVQQVAGLSYHKLIEHYVARGIVRGFRGTKCWYVDPADLVAVQEIDWGNPPAELALAALAGHRARVHAALVGRLVELGRAA